MRNAIIHFGLTDLGLHRIEALVMLENSASMRTLRRLGFHEEGTLRDYGHWKGRFGISGSSMREEAPPTIHIRRALPDDAVAIAAVLYQSFVEYESAYTPEAFAATTPTADQIRDRMHEGPIWVAVQQNAVVGTVSAVPKGEALYLRSMAVTPTARGYGIGYTLLAAAERFAIHHGFMRLVLRTTPFLTSAIQLYEHYGLARSNEGPHALLGTPLFTMVKTVS
jgi:GNAT superfamily N-acetyltransferase